MPPPSVRGCVFESRACSWLIKTRANAELVGARRCMRRCSSSNYCWWNVNRGRTGNPSRQRETNHHQQTGMALQFVYHCQVGERERLNGESPEL